MNGQDDLKAKDIHKEQTSRMSRRKLLNTLASVGFALPTAIHITSEDIRAASSDEVPIVIGFDQEDPENPHESFTPVKKNVPADWYNNLQEARKAKEEAIDEYSDIPYIIGIGPRSPKHGGENAKLEIDVEEDKLDKAVDTLPEQINNIPVEIVPSGRGSPDSCNTSDDGKWIRGGNQCYAEDGEGNEGTLLPRMYNSDGKRRFATAQHLFNSDDDDKTDYTGKKLYHPTESHDAIGEVTESHCHDDFVICDELNDHYPQRAIKGVSPETVSGQWTKDGLSDLEADDKKLRKMGRTSCETKGEIKNVDKYAWPGFGCRPRDHQVAWGEGSDSEDGDSGAPVFHEHPDEYRYLWIASMISWSDDGSGDYVAGTSAYSIKNSHGYHF